MVFTPSILWCYCYSHSVDFHVNERRPDKKQRFVSTNYIINTFVIYLVNKVQISCGSRRMFYECEVNALS